MNLPKTRHNDPETLDMVRSMIRRGYTDDAISNHVGMVIQQVRSLRRNTPLTRALGKPRTVPVVPLLEGEREREERSNNERSCQAYARAMDRYFLDGGRMS